MVGVTHPLSGAEIKALYEAIANAYTDTKNTKLAGVETSAKDDLTGAEIKVLVANLLTHSESVNRLKKISIGLADYTTGTRSATLSYSTIDLATTQIAWSLNLKIPDDYVSFSKVYMVYKRTGNEPIVDIYAHYAASNEAYNVHNDTNANLTCNQAGTANDIGIMDTGLTLASLLVGDYLGIKLISDTNNFTLLGFIFEYTANM